MCRVVFVLDAIVPNVENKNNDVEENEKMQKIRDMANDI